MEQTDFEQFPSDVSTEARTNMIARSRRVKQLLGTIAEQGSKMEESMLIARYAIKNQVKGDTARAYLRELLDAQYVFRHDDHVLVLADYENKLNETIKDTGKAG